MVDIGATNSSLESNVAARSRLIVEAHDNILTSLNGGDHWVEGIIRFIPLKMGECIRFFYLIMMHL